MDLPLLRSMSYQICLPVFMPMPTDYRAYRTHPLYLKRHAYSRKFLMLWGVESCVLWAQRYPVPIWKIPQLHPLSLIFSYALLVPNSHCSIVVTINKMQRCDYLTVVVCTFSLAWRLPDFGISDSLWPPPNSLLSQAFGLDRPHHAFYFDTLPW
jgi:hypothetical protein